ncbi:DUF1080 domain-containing protein [Arenibacter sp. F26102]|uniref:3-keto-disaccharide hydrolase n=1 Tax=Arenibacter sp. F26102 TaxID=2926416 RepID=UPI001FF59F11|nr:DUF1080 domain-containing protein [Arenibacter sp. F26102]MCK0148159.1 DUF1080 domain-containing protein [Arenibacter sp. F26102]
MKRTLTFIIALFTAFNALAVNLAPSEATNPFMGMWGLDIEGGGAGWLNVHQDQGFLDAELLWIGGSVVPVANVYLADENTLVVTRTNQVKRSADRSHTVTYTLEVKKVGDVLQGTMSGPNRDGNGVSVKNFTGKRMPPMPNTPDLSKVKFDKPIILFNGKDLSGWKMIDLEKANGFKVVDGTLMNDPVQPEDGEHISYGNIRTLQEFNDFNLKLEVNVPEGNNSGVYLRGLYEIQVVDSYGKELDSHNMGALYSRITPSMAAEKPAGEWQSFDITLVDRHVTVIFNGKKIIDNQPVWGPTGGALSSDVLSPGPIYLQGDHGNVAYRNIVLTPIK